MQRPSLFPALPIPRTCNQLLYLEWRTETGDWAGNITAVTLAG